MIRAILLLNVQSGREIEIVEKLKNKDELKIALKDSFITFGEYDLVFIVEAENATSLGHLVTGNIRKLDGVLKTATLIEAVSED